MIEAPHWLEATQPRRCKAHNTVKSKHKYMRSGKECKTISSEGLSQAFMMDISQTMPPDSKLKIQHYE